MKDINYLIVAFLLFSVGSCKKDDDKPEQKQTLQVNFYKSASAPNATDVPQTTIKGETFQITSIGDNVNGVPRRINKVYISDTENQTEWVVVLDRDGLPTFVYQVNTATGEREQDLYWYHRESESVSYLRYYSYDWTNRLGTLRYEMRTTDDGQEVIFDELVAGIVSPERIVSVAPLREIFVGKKRNMAFPTPVFSLESGLFSSRHWSAQRIVAQAGADESLDEAFDRGVGELLESLRSLKDELFDGICAVNRASSGRGAGCRILDVLKEVTDRQIFEDINGSRRRQESNGNPAESNTYEGSLFNLDLGIFDLSGISGDLRRHFNNIRNNIQGIDFSELLTTLADLVNIEPQDLDDLTDSRGVIHVGLSWNSTSDIDLHVVDPFGERIYYAHPTSTSGGYLDRDDVDGYGPENIYWGSDAPDGRYTVYVHYYDNNSTPAPASTYYVKIVNGLGAEHAKQGVLTAVDEMDLVATFTKQGGTLLFD